MHSTQNGKVSQGLKALSDLSANDLHPAMRDRLIEAVRLVFDGTIASLLSCTDDDMARVRGMAQGYSNILNALAKGKGDNG
jgi:hypothetical protein